MDAIREEAGRPRVEVAGYPNFDFFGVFEFFLLQEVLHWPEQMVVRWGQVWTIWRVRQEFPAQFLDFVLSDFRDVRAGADLEKLCLGGIHSFASQCLVHPV
jgi:hypothetical protein